MHHLSCSASLLKCVAFIPNYHFVASAAAWWLWWWYLCVFEVGQKCCSKIATPRQAGSFEVMLLDLGVGFDFPVSMSVLTLSEHASCTTEQFRFDCHKLTSSVMEGRIRIRETANEREHCTVWCRKRWVRKTMKKPNFFVIVLTLLASLIIGTIFTSVRNL